MREKLKELKHKERKRFERVSREVLKEAVSPRKRIVSLKQL